MVLFSFFRHTTAALPETLRRNFLPPKTHSALQKNFLFYHFPGEHTWHRLVTAPQQRCCTPYWRFHPSLIATPRVAFFPAYYSEALRAALSRLPGAPPRWTSLRKRAQQHLQCASWHRSKVTGPVCLKKTPENFASRDHDAYDLVIPDPFTGLGIRRSRPSPVAER
jgi:hypothetical protein